MTKKKKKKKKKKNEVAKDRSACVLSLLTR